MCVLVYVHAHVYVHVYVCVCSMAKTASDPWGERMQVHVCMFVCACVFVYYVCVSAYECACVLCVSVCYVCVLVYGYVNVSMQVMCVRIMQTLIPWW